MSTSTETVANPSTTTGDTITALLPEKVPSEHIAVSVLVFLALLVLLLLAVVGNVLVICVVAKHLKCLSLTNAFLVSLAVSDLLAAFICLPMTMLDMVLDGAVFFNELCVVNAFFNNLSSISSSFILACVALDRYYALGGTPRLGPDKRATTQGIITAWTAAILLSMPWYALPLLQDGQQVYIAGAHHCMYAFHFSVPHRQLAYNSTVTLLGYIAPLVVMSTCSIRLWSVVRQSQVQVIPLSCQSSQLPFNAEVRTAKSMFIMVFLFTITKGAYLLLGLGVSMLGTQFRYPMDVVAILLFWGNCVASPIVYALRNPNFSSFIHLPCWRHSSRRNERSFTNLSTQQPGNPIDPQTLSLAKRMSIFTSRGSVSTSGEPYEVDPSYDRRNSLSTIAFQEVPHFHNTWLSTQLEEPPTMTPF